MDNRKVDFSIQAAVLDKYIKLENPIEDSVATGVVLKRIKESEDLQRYFFGQNPSPGWAEILYENGFFDSPPSVIKTDVGYQIPPWLLSSYLAKVASNVPSVVDSVIHEIRTDNPIIHTDLMEALANIPALVAVKHTPKVLQWIENEFTFWGFTEAVSSLIMHLAEFNFITEAMDLLRSILSPIPSEGKKYHDFYIGGYVWPRFDLNYLRPDFWSVTIPSLGEIAPSELIYILERSLLLAIRYEIEAKGREYRNDDWLTYGWRASIGDSSQDSTDTYKDKLLVSLRDTLDSWIGKDPVAAKPLLEEYLDKDEVILRRVAIFLIAVHSSKYLDFASTLLKDQDLHQDFQTHNEYFRLLAETYPNLSHEDKQRILAIILEGPDPLRTEELSEIVSSERGVDKDEYAKRHHEIWIRDRLWVIQSSLPDNITQILKDYCDLYGSPQHPDFLIWSTSSEGYWIKEISPLPKEDLAKMHPESLLEYLKTWEPDIPGEFGPEEVSLRGLSDAAASLIMEFPDRYTDLFNKLTKAPSEITASIFSTARERYKEKSSVPWPQLLVLAHNTAFDIYKTNPGNWEGDNRVARITAIQFIHEALSTIDSLPPEYIPIVKDIVLIYLRDPDPDEDQDKPPDGWFGHEDPMTIAINSIRSIALMSLMLIINNRLSNWKEEKDQDGIDSNPTLKELLDPIIIKALNNKLDKSEDSSWAVHSVFGQYTRLLSEIDWIWFSSNIQDIFPINGDELNDRYFTAAWETYVIYNRPSRKMLDALQSQYIYAIYFLSEGKTTRTHLDYVGRLAQHLIYDYLWKPYDLFGEFGKTQLLGLLFSLCNQNIRGHVIWMLWRIVKSIPKSEIQKYWSSVENIWKWRLNEASLSSYPEEYRNEMEEFSHLPSLAPLSESITSLWPFLESLLPYMDSYRVWRNLEEFLAARVKDSPEKTIRFYLYMHERPPKPQYGYHHYGEESDMILNTAVKYLSSRKDALKVMDIIYRRGDDRYKQLYEEYS